MRDLLGVLCSGMCFVHCVSLPLLMLAGVSVTGSVFGGEEMVHFGLGALIVAFALSSFPSGFKRHGQKRPVVVACVGLMIMLMTLFVSAEYEIYLGSLSALILIFAHLANRSALRAMDTVTA